jgi:uncharacterized coiled-coil DUF342 family protein
MTHQKMDFKDWNETHRETLILAKNERHHNLKETMYWCNQYKQKMFNLAGRLDDALKEIDRLHTEIIRLMGTRDGR